MSISAKLIKLVPEGEANAVSGRVLWQQLGMWSPVSVKHTLKKMAAAGEIERKHVPHPTGEVGLYFKQPSRPQ